MRRLTTSLVHKRGEMQEKRGIPDVVMARFRCPGCLWEFVAALPSFDKKLPKCPACKSRGWLLTHPTLDKERIGV